MEKSRVLMIIPAFNEQESILTTIETIENYSNDGFELDYIVVNDGSTDNTQYILNENNKNFITLITNLGIGGAVQTGYRYASINNYDIAVQYDGDGQHDINSLEQLIEPIITEKYNFVIGSRYLPGAEARFQSTILRRFGINIISKLINLICKLKLYDTTSGFRAADKKVIEYFSKNYPLKYPEPESVVLLKKEKFRISEVAVNMFERKAGQSSITPVKSIRYMFEVCTSIILLGLKKSKEDLL